MRRLKKHIAFILLGFFIFPFAFQAIHIAANSPQHCISFDPLCCCQENYHGYSFVMQELIHSDRHCAICDYQFTVTNTPCFSDSAAFIPLISCIFRDVYANQLHQLAFTFKSPRAPPLS